MTTLLCKRVTVAKFKEVKTGSNLAESSKEYYGSKRAVLPMMKMMIYLNYPSHLLPTVDTEILAYRITIFLYSIMGVKPGLSY
jgi:hypothetical protein